MEYADEGKNATLDRRVILKVFFPPGQSSGYWGRGYSHIKKQRIERS